MSNQKVVIVTGAGSGIGYATAKRFARDGFRVILNGRTESKLNKVADELGVDNSLVVCGDISHPETVNNIIVTATETFGRIDVLVNNAATFVGGTIEELSLEDWNKQMAVNATGPFLMIKNALPFLEESKGSIVNVSSVSGIGGDWGGFCLRCDQGSS